MITGVVLARNEEANVVACLEAFRPHVDEVILIDMESDDRTVALAAPFVERTLSHRKVPNFDAARNVAIDVARYEWLWFCDADERVSVEVGRAVRDLVRERGNEFEALTIPFKTYFCGKWIEHCGWWPGYTMPRVMKRGHFRFREQLHGGVQVDGRQLRFGSDPRLGIDHYSYLSLAHYYEKFNRYTSTEAAQLAERGATWDWRAATQAMVRDLWIYYEHNRGWADGAHGWILSWLSGQYRWASHAKLIDAKSLANDSAASFPVDLDEFFAEAQRELGRLRSHNVAPPLAVLWRTPLEDPSGYAEEGRCFSQALAAGNRRVRVEPIRWNDRTVAIPDRDRGLYRALQNVELPPHFIAITNCIPTLAKPVAGAAINILRTTFETDRLPPEWHAHLAAFDEIWVISRFNRDSFVRSGVAPEKLRVVPSCLNTELFTPLGPRRNLPAACEGRFVFLAVFDWQLRKGWDVLLKAFVREFSVDDRTVLLLKVSRAHGHSAEMLRRQVAETLAEAQTSPSDRPDIVFLDELLDSPGMAALYRSADAFVSASRGEGWGRPYMEAMACGVPTIGVAASGNLDFMTSESSLLIPATATPISEAAAQEISVFRGHHWFEPDEAALRRGLRRMRDDASLRRGLATTAPQEIRSRFGIPQATVVLDEALTAAERRFTSSAVGEKTVDSVRVELQGEFLAGHSFSNVNEYLATEFAADPSVAITLTPRFEVTSDRLKRHPRGNRLESLLGRYHADGTQVVVRHAFPPDWSDVPQGKWVHIQPWEFGWLPNAWLEPLRNRVDEIWAPSHYVRRVYERSGIPADKIHVIPWGVDPAYFHRDAIPRLLPTSKSFRFAYVGGTVARKGFDLLLEAYLAEFRREEDVALVVKDVGVDTVYRYGNFRERIAAAMQATDAPEIVYFDEEMTSGQIASLLTACHCLAAPYRGEGFGLPILEAMACGLAPIVPRGGPSDDFVDDECGYIVETREVRVTHPEPLCGPPTELEVDLGALRRALRRAFEERTLTTKLGRTAAQRVGTQFTWKRTAEAMTLRLQALIAPQQNAAKESDAAPRSEANGVSRLPLTVVVTGISNGFELADVLSRMTTFVSKTLVVHSDSAGVVAEIANEYGAQLISPTAFEDDPDEATPTDNAYRVVLNASERPSEEDWETVAAALGNAQSTMVSVALKNGRIWRLVRREDAAVERPTALPKSAAESAGLAHFRTEYLPYLERRSGTFQAMLEHLERRSDRNRRIVETGCIRLPNDWGAGQSTLIFDRYVHLSGGSLISIDNDPNHCRFARASCASPATTITCNDSVRELSHLAAEEPRSIDLLYLDSFDVDWRDPHPSALHHFKELCAGREALKHGALVVVDDHRGPQGAPGKSLYVADFMRSIGARIVFEDYQIGWIMP